CPKSTHSGICGIPAVIIRRKRAVVSHGHCSCHIASCTDSFSYFFTTTPFPPGITGHSWPFVYYLIKYIIGRCPHVPFPCHVGIVACISDQSAPGLIQSRCIHSTPTIR